VAADLVVAAGVRVLVAQAAEDLHGGVTLLGRGVLVSGQDVVDNLVKGTRYGRGRRVGARVRGGLWLSEDLADLPPRVAEDPGDLAYAHAVAVREANPGVVVHRQHPCLRSVEPLGDWPYWNGCGWGGSILLADPAAGGGSLLRADNHAAKERWTGSLTVPTPGGEPATLSGAGSGLFPLLTSLDRQYRATLK